jgi:hypothetical protein
MLCTARRWLHRDDPLRGNRGNQGPPEARTHAKACQEAKESERHSQYVWNSKHHVRKSTGVNYWSPLSVLSMFNMIWDFCPDMMHIIKTFFERLALGVFRGKRTPSAFGMREPTMPTRDDTLTRLMAARKNPPTEAATAKALSDAKLKYDKATKKYAAQKALHARDTKADSLCIFDIDEARTVDERVKNLLGYPRWIKSTLVRIRMIFVYIATVLHKNYDFAMVAACELVQC